MIKEKIDSSVKIWLWTGFIMILVQILIGGVTRLTGSGLSITRWDIITGTIPPLGVSEWIEAFDAYKATPQYQKINEGMSLSEFKFIYFWEYFHRLWARLMGFVFILPLIYFLIRKMIPGWLKARLLIVFLLAGLVASFGWIMVASGLVDRPWVSAYKLSFHLTLAVVLLAYLFITILNSYKINTVKNSRLFRFSVLLSIGIFLQIFLGGMVSGMKAALLYPTFPDMKGNFVPDILYHSSYWSVDNLLHYEKSPFFPSLVHFLHRIWAYVLVILSSYFIYRLRNVQLPRYLSYSQIMLIIVLIIQIILGILTVINSQGTVPVGLGVMHQICGILFFVTSLIFSFGFRKG